MNPIKLAQAIPAKARLAVYSILATAYGLEKVWDVLPSPLEGKVLDTLVVLGFGIAVSNVPSKGV